MFVFKEQRVKVPGAPLDTQDPVSGERDSLSYRMGGSKMKKYTITKLYSSNKQYMIDRKLQSSFFKWS